MAARTLSAASSSLEIHSMETLYDLEPTDPPVDPREEQDTREAGLLFVRLRGSQVGLDAAVAQARGSGMMANSLAAVMGDAGAQRALVNQTHSLPELGTWDATRANASPRVSTPIWDENAVGLGFAQVLRSQGRAKTLTMRYLKRMRTACEWDREAQVIQLLRPFEGAIRIVRGAGLIQADMFDGSDSYCEVYWNDERVGTTRVIVSTPTNPHATMILMCFC